VFSLILKVEKEDKNKCYAGQNCVNIQAVNTQIFQLATFKSYLGDTSPSKKLVVLKVNKLRTILTVRVLAHHTGPVHFFNIGWAKLLYT